MKKIIILTIAAILVLSLASCGEKAADSDTANEKTEETTTPVTTVSEETTEAESAGEDITSLLVGTWDGDTATANGSIEEYVFNEDFTVIAIGKNGNNSSKSVVGTYRIDTSENAVYVEYPVGTTSPITGFPINSGENKCFEFSIKDNSLTIKSLATDTVLSKQ